MVCIKCGYDIPKGTKYCIRCGAMAPKKKPIGLIIAIISAIILLIGGGIFVFLWINNPGRIVHKAIEESDTETILEYYGKLKDEDDIEQVKELMLKLAKDTYSDYVDEEISYDEAVDILESLGKEVLEDNADYEKILSDIELIAKGRKYFMAAESCFDDEDYEEAIENYLKVESVDKKYYKKAQSRIDECKMFLIVPIDGKWSLEYDFGDYLAIAAGINYEVYFPVEVAFEFNEDGTGVFGIDNDSLNEAIDILIPQLSDYVYDTVMREYGFSRSEVDIYLMVMGYDSMDEYLNEIAADYMEEALQKTFGSSNQTQVAFTYTWDGAVIDLIDVGCKMNVDVIDDSIYINSVDGDLYLNAAFLSIGYPIILDRVG